MAGIIFDLDGTLLNTLADIGNACNHILTLNGYQTHTIQQYKQMVGNGFDMTLERAIAPNPLPENFPELVGKARAWYGEHMTIDTVPYPGIINALKMLAGKAKLAILSNKPDHLTVRLAKYYFPEISFFQVIGAKPDVPLKPNPQSVLALLNEMNEEAANSFFVGDSNVDVITAHAAGMSAVGTAWGFRGEKELVQAGADLILHEPIQLGGLL